MPITWTRAKQLGALDDGRILFLVMEFLEKIITKEKKKVSYLSSKCSCILQP
jgi:hypothetical protein